MKKFKNLRIVLKVLVLAISLGIVSFLGLILYIKMSPKLEIKSANAFLMYLFQHQYLFQY